MRMTNSDPDSEQVDTSCHIVAGSPTITLCEFLMTKMIFKKLAELSESPQVNLSLNNHYLYT